VGWIVTTAPLAVSGMAWAANNRPVRPPKNDEGPPIGEGALPGAPLGLFRSCSWRSASAVGTDAPAPPPPQCLPPSPVDFALHPLNERVHLAATASVPSTRFGQSGWHSVGRPSGSDSSIVESEDC